ncbi:MAG TPA: hypothetical protein VJ824_10935 [Bacillota bacterium]|nr:hypothetical protein [Bacillota bacterium]
MPHRLLQAVWQAQQALQQVHQMAQQLLQEQEIRNSWYQQGMHNPLYPSAFPTNYPSVQQGLPFNPVQQFVGHIPNPSFQQPMNNIQPTLGYESMVEPKLTGTYIEPVFEEMHIDSMNEEKQPQPQSQSKPKSTKK